MAVSKSQMISMAFKILYHFWVLMLLLSMFSTLLSAGTNNDILGRVQVEEHHIDLQQDSLSKIRWELNRNAQVTLQIVNLNGRIMRTLLNNIEYKAGKHAQDWDGMDHSGKPVPDGIYLPVLTAKGIGGKEEIYNPTNSNWGDTVFPKDLYYDFEKKSVHYRFDQPVLCRLRVGERDGGPLYATLFDWQPREAGTYDYSWDGWDEQGVVHVVKNKKHYIVVEGASLPENYFTVSESPRNISSFEEFTEKIPLQEPGGKLPVYHLQHPVGKCRDLELSALIDGNKIPDGKPVEVTGTIEIKLVTGSEEDIASHIADSFEIYLFVDGEFSHEAVPEKPPAVINLDTTKYADGAYFLTLNSKVGEDHLGAMSLKIVVKNSTN